MSSDVTAPQSLGETPAPCDLAVRSQRVGLMALVLVAATVVAFSFLFRCGFTSWDDDWTIEHNAKFNPPSVHGVLHYWSHPYMDLYVPVTYTVWGALAFLTQSRDGAGEVVFDARVFHATNVALHLAAALILFALLRRLLKHDLGAWAGAMLFALHPVQVEPVGWVSGLKDVLCGLFVVSSVWQYVIWAQKGEARPAPRATPEEGAPVLDPRWAHYGAGVLLFTLGLLSKPTAMIAPALAMAIDLIVLRRGVKKVAAAVAPWFVLSAACMVWTKMCQPAHWAEYVPLWQRPLVAADALAFYVYKLLWPAHLYFDYGRNPAAALRQGWLFWTWVVPAAVFASIVHLARRNWQGNGYHWRHLAAGAAGMVIGVAPVLGFSKFDFQQISTVADHYLYPAMIGVALATGALVAWAVETAAARVRQGVDAAEWRRQVCSLAACAIAAVATALGARTAVQTRVWAGPEELNRHELTFNPHSFSAYQNLGLHYNRQGFLFQAQAEWANLQGDKGAAKVLLGEGLKKFGEAEKLFAKVMELEPRYVFAYHSRGEALGMLGRFDEAEKCFDVALRWRHITPVDAQKTLVNDYMLRGLALMELKQYKEAARCFKTMLREVPGFEPATRNLAVAQEKLRLAEAEQQVPKKTESATVDPGSALK